MNDEEFRALLDLVMVSDPWPLGSASERIVKNLLDREAKERGYADWINAYHVHE